MTCVNRSKKQLLLQPLESSRACRQFLGKLRRLGYRNRIMIDAI